MGDLISLLRIIFLRGSPERLLYSRWKFIAGLGTAMVLSGAVQRLYHEDHWTFVILRIFAELVPFMLWMVLATSKVARLRLALAMYCLVWISAFGDLVLLPFALLPVEVKPWLALAWAVPLVYGAANVIGWARRNPLNVSLIEVGLYVGAVLGLNASFRGLYQIMAGG